MPDIAYGQILEALNDKVDLSGSWSAPSSNVINFSQVASNDTLTMPADGYMTAEYTGTQDYYNWCELTVAGRVKQGAYTRASNWMGITIPVKKGDVVIVGYDIGASGTFRRLTFTYAQKTN